MEEVWYGKTRIRVIELSLYLELVSSELLAALLGIKSETNSISFGNTSQALGLNQKINLLLDLNVLDDNDMRFMRNCFMPTRNQFAHNLTIETFKDLFKHNLDIRKATKKALDVENIDEIEDSVICLAIEARIHKIIGSIAEGLKKKMDKMEINEKLNAVSKIPLKHLTRIN